MSGFGQAFKWCRMLLLHSMPNPLTSSYVLQPKLYLAGSSRDVNTDPNVNIAIVTAGALAIAAIASGLVINFQSKPRGMKAP